MKGFLRALRAKTADREGKEMAVREDRNFFCCDVDFCFARSTPV